MTRPSGGARLAHILLASPDPAASIAFYGKLLAQKPWRRTRDLSYAEFRLGDLILAIAPDLDAGERRLYGHSRAPARRGFGAMFVFSVPDFAAHLRRARRLGGGPLMILAGSPGEQAFSMQDPAGYVIELTDRVL